eukprot:TRINITY_DN4826_c0_g1_i1.p2 TRINITY_DN4826_c0_g1~~TRINITY_DN4826_c0_g1_i1.p2  ORF type:complete len:222 (+),score=14.86 TRINITY_DN4826_c0_g1_i1:196-861(+)
MIHSLAPDATPPSPRPHAALLSPTEHHVRCLPAGHPLHRHGRCVRGGAAIAAEQQGGHPPRPPPPARPPLPHPHVRGRHGQADGIVQKRRPRPRVGPEVRPPRRALRQPRPQADGAKRNECRHRRAQRGRRPRAAAAGAGAVARPPPSAAATGSSPTDTPWQATILVSAYTHTTGLPRQQVAATQAAARAAHGQRPPPPSAPRRPSSGAACDASYASRTAM